MKNKIFGIFVCLLLIASAVPIVKSLNSNLITCMELTGVTQTFEALSMKEIQKIFPSDGEADDYFGFSVSLDGDTALIGAAYSDDNGVDSGSAYVFIRTGATWTQQQKLLAADGATQDFFGWSVSLDGDTAFIGAYGDDDNGVDSGSVYVFIRTGTIWTQQAKLTALDIAPGDCFGGSVSIDGDTAVIGSELNVGTGYGSVYVFTRTDNTWTQQAKLVASDGSPSDYFGWSVSLDHDTALIGSVWDNGRTGSAYVFVRNGTTWTQQSKLLASDGANEDYFSYSVSLSGNTAIVGSYGDDDNGDMSGSAYVFIRNGTIWTQQAKILASDGVANDYFGQPVSLDGDTAIIGACSANSYYRGSAYVFSRNGTSWTQQQKLLASDGALGQCFGWSISLNGDTAIIGAAWDDDNGYLSGSAYVFAKEYETQPPTIPIISGSTKVKVGKLITYTFVSTDSDLDNVYYSINWSDGSPEVCIGPFASGEEVNATHSWSKKGTCIIKAKAIDIHYAQSDWGSLDITVPSTYSLNLLFLRFLERFPMLQKILSFLNI